MNKKTKATADILAIACGLVCIITGIMLHIDVWHRFVYNDKLLWGIHETAGFIMLAAVILHCCQHSFWFKNYKKIAVDKKRITTFLLLVGVTEAVTGIILFCGSRSHLASRIHYIGGILFTIVAIGHVAKRMKLFTSLLKK